MVIINNVDHVVNECRFDMTRPLDDWRDRKALYEEFTKAGEPGHVIDAFLGIEREEDFQSYLSRNHEYDHLVYEKKIDLEMIAGETFYNSLNSKYKKWHKVLIEHETEFFIEKFYAEKIKINRKSYNRLIYFLDLNERLHQLLDLIYLQSTIYENTFEISEIKENYFKSLLQEIEMAPRMPDEILNKNDYGLLKNLSSKILSSITNGEVISLTQNDNKILHKIYYLSSNNRRYLFHFDIQKLVFAFRLFFAERRENTLTNALNKILINARKRDIVSLALKEGGLNVFEYKEDIEIINISIKNFLEEVNSINTFYYDITSNHDSILTTTNNLDDLYEISQIVINQRTINIKFKFKNKLFNLNVGKKLYKLIYCLLDCHRQKIQAIKSKNIKNSWRELFNQNYPYKELPIKSLKIYSRHDSALIQFLSDIL